jgi:hypothetical protein
MSEHPSPEIREITPQSEVLRQLALAHDRFADSAEMHRLLGNVVEAEGADWYAERCLRAFRAENEDPTPRSWDEL